MVDKIRALRYAKTLVAFQEIGMGPDKNLSKVHQVVQDLRVLCQDETGIWLETYPKEFVKKEEAKR